MQDHNNLTTEQKTALGFVHSINRSIEGLIFEFEHSSYKDYEKLSHEIVWKTKLRDEYAKKVEELNTPNENIKAFYKGIVKGLINPNRLSYVAYYE